MEANNVNIQDIFSGKIYRIPSFNRGYAWDANKEVNQLLEDLYEAFDLRPDMPYPIGVSIYYTDEQRKRYVVDGQQRLITFSLLCAGLYRALSAGPKWEEMRLRLKQGFVDSWTGVDISLIEPDDEEDSKVLHTICSFVLGDGQLRKNSKHKIAKAFRWIEESIQDKFDTNLDLVQDFARFVWRNVYCIMINDSDSDNALTVFERINNRGKDLMPKDLIKSYCYQFKNESIQRLSTSLYKQMKKQDEKLISSSSNLFQALFFIQHGVYSTYRQHYTNFKNYYSTAASLNTGLHKLQEIMETSDFIGGAMQYELRRDKIRCSFHWFRDNYKEFRQLNPIFLWFVLNHREALDDVIPIFECLTLCIQLSKLRGSACQQCVIRWFAKVYQGVSVEESIRLLLLIFKDFYGDDVLSRIDSLKYAYHVHNKFIRHLIFRADCGHLLDYRLVDGISSLQLDHIKPQKGVHPTSQSLGNLQLLYSTPNKVKSNKDGMVESLGSNPYTPLIAEATNPDELEQLWGESTQFRKRAMINWVKTVVELKDEP